jgi:hypothetical protein
MFFIAGLQLPRRRNKYRKLKKIFDFIKYQLNNYSKVIVFYFDMVILTFY